MKIRKVEVVFEMVKKMMKYFFLLVIVFSCQLQPSPELRKTDNLKAFAHAYGLVKYFHPSDEASEIDWNKFASYGASKVMDCKTDEELLNELKRLFSPVAPSVTFSSERVKDDDFAKFNPPNPQEFKLTFWQHRGVGLGMTTLPESPYSSVRVNSPVKVEMPKTHGILTHVVDVREYGKTKLKLTAMAKLADSSKVSAYLRLAAINTDGSTILEKSNIKDNRWSPYEITFETGDQVERLEIGVALKGDTSLFLDAVHLHYWNENRWEAIPVDNGDFENAKTDAQKSSESWSVRGPGYGMEISKDTSVDNNTFARFFYKEPTPVINKRLFDASPVFGEMVNKKIGNSIFCQVPIALYRNDNGTFPKVDSIRLQMLQRKVDSMPNSVNDPSVRLGNIINTYNVFQHFYPHMDVVGVDWENELTNALSRSLTDSTGQDHYVTLEKFTAPLKDAHIYVNFPSDIERYAPRITWEWVEDKLIITNVLDHEIPLEIGDIVTHVNGVDSKAHFKEVESRISAGTKGWLDYKAKTKSLLGKRNSSIILKVNGREISLKRESLAYNEPPRQSTYEKLGDSTLYLNLTQIEMESISKLLPELRKSKGIICDLRGYPNANHELISHFLKEKDTSTSWMQVPKFIYPDRKGIKGFEKAGWLLPAAEPYLGNKQIVFITNGSAISYAESILALVKGYDLGTIIGQPTAGANGNFNSFKLEGGISVNWTGMKVLKHNGAQHHAVGVIPDVMLSKTIEGVRAGRDEFLEKALELVE
ncbi:MAG: S41 family peptidase [Bacteroidota bacterium]